MDTETIDRGQPLRGMRALITGGGGAIGGSAAVLLARDGAHVLLAGRTRSKLERVGERVTEAVGSGAGSYDLMEMDALDEDAVINMTQRTGGSEGRIDVAVAADELGTAGVRVNVVRPGLVRNGNPGHLSEDAEAIDRYMAEQPIARPGEAMDVGHAIRYLAGPESSWVTGQSITVDGGTSLRRFPDLTEVWKRRGVNTSIPGKADSAVTVT